MKIGAVFPTCEIGNDPHFIRDWVQTAEDLGFSHVVCYDHVLGAVHDGRQPPLSGPYTEKDPFHEPLVLFSFLAAITSRIELATGILILPQRQTVLVAKQVAELQLLSQGRFRLGVGTGWNPVEYESLGEDFDSRGVRFNEQVVLLRKLWSEDVLDYRGEYHRVDRAGLLPRPVADVPLWFGGFQEVALRRAARLGDGFSFGSTPQRLSRSFARAQELLRENRRKSEDFGTEALLDFSAPRASWLENIQCWQELGGTHLVLRAMDTGAEFSGEKVHGYRGPQSYIDALETFMETIGGAEEYAPRHSATDPAASAGEPKG